MNDFGPLDTRTITFSSGSMVDDIECTDYLITDDEFKEGPENFAVLLSAADTVDTIVGNTSVFITIEDDMDGALRASVAYTKPLLFAIFWVAIS